MQKFWSVNSTLSQERHVYACTEGCITKLFYAKYSQGNFLPWELFKKDLQGGNRRECTPPPKKTRSVKKTLDTRFAPRVFKHFKFFFMHSWMLCAPHLVPDIECFAKINHIICNWEQKYGNKFPRDWLK